MAPTLREGDFVVTAQVGRNDWPEIRERQLYLVIDTGGNPHLSRIKNRLGDYQFIACTCDNPDKGQYPDRNLMEHEIAEIWEVKYPGAARCREPGHRTTPARDQRNPEISVETGRQSRRTPLTRNPLSLQHHSALRTRDTNIFYQ